jgi:hypothetical protein
MKDEKKMSGTLNNIIADTQDMGDPTAKNELNKKQVIKLCKAINIVCK